MRANGRATVGIGAAVGIALGALGTAVQGLVGQVDTALLWSVVVPAGTAMGLLGGTLAGGISWALIRRRKPIEYSFRANFTLVSSACLAAAVLVYLIFFAFQSAQAPASMIVLPSAIYAAAILGLIRGRAESPRRALRSDWLRAIAALLSGTAGAVIVGWIVFVATPRSIDPALTWASLASVPPEAQQDVIERIAVFTFIIFSTVSIVSVGLRFLNRGGLFAGLVAGTVPLAVALVHLGWLGYPSTSALVLLANQPSPSSPALFALQASGWLTLVAWIFLWLRGQGRSR